MIKNLKIAIKDQYQPKILQRKSRKRYIKLIIKYKKKKNNKSYKCKKKCYKNIVTKELNQVDKIPKTNYKQSIVIFNKKI